MAYKVPDFPLTCNIWSFFAAWPPGAPRLSPACNLAYSLRGPLSTPLSSQRSVYLLFPKGTDVRSNICVGGLQDIIECPAGSGRTYEVQDVDDAGKGFPNEHRIARVMAVMFSGGAGHAWPVPIP